MPSNHLILCCPLLLLSSIFPSIRIFSSESVLHIRWPKYWSFSFSISPSNEYSGLISFSITLVGSPCSPSDSQESSPTPQFKSICYSTSDFLTCLIGGSVLLCPLGCILLRFTFLIHLSLLPFAGVERPDFEHFINGIKSV